MGGDEATIYPSPLVLSNNAFLLYIYMYLYMCVHKQIDQLVPRFLFLLVYFCGCYYFAVIELHQSAACFTKAWHLPMGFDVNRRSNNSGSI